MNYQYDDQRLSLCAGSLPDGFRAQPDGIYRENIDNSGKATWRYLCSPLCVRAQFHDGRGVGWGILIEVQDGDGRWHPRPVEARLLSGDGCELRAMLLDLGLHLGPGRPAHAALSNLLMNWRPEARAITTRRLGWVNDDCSAFVLGDGRILGDQAVVVLRNAGPTAGAEMTAAGSLLDWQAQVARPCVGNDLLVMAVSQALAGPLLELLGMDGGGIHLRGASSRGKSTLQRAAVSVWGGPRFMHTWRATANGLEGVATACNASILVLDEMGEASSHDVDKAAYMLGNGMGKIRANRHGQSRQPAHWRVMILSSGELSLANKLAETGKRPAAGQEVRLLDLEADGRAYGAFDTLHGSSDGAAFSNTLRDAAAQHYGTAGPAFVTRLLQDKEGTVAALKAWMVRFQEEAKKYHPLADGQVARATERFALIAAAGEMATRYDVTGWPQGTALNALLAVWRCWVEGRGSAGPLEAPEAIARVKDFLTAHGAARFEVIDKTGLERPVADRAGWVDERCYYITPGAWKKVHSGMDPKKAGGHLQEAGFLHVVESKGHQYRVSLPDGSRPRVYAIRRAILDH